MDENAEDKRVCTKCTLPKDIEEFRKNPRYAGGRESWCFGCKAEYQRYRYLVNKDAILAKQAEWYKANKAKHAAAAKAYRQKNPERFKEYEANYRRENKATLSELAKKYYKRDKPRRQVLARWRMLRTNYDMTPERYDEMFAQQRGLCATCSKPPGLFKNGNPRRLVVDHDHSNGRVRRLLCYECNSVLGLAKENPKTLRCLADYIEEFKVLFGTIPAGTAGSV